MQEQTLFYLVFFGQIMLISFYLPRKMLKRTRFLLETYPPSAYPALYPEPLTYYHKAQLFYRNFSAFILLVGLLLLAIFIGYSGSADWDAGNIAFVYFMLQFFPLAFVELKSFQHYKLMRQADKRTTRQADLKPRRLFDFVSPLLVGTAVLVYIAFIGLILYIDQFDFPWFGGYGNIIGITASNLFFAAIIAWNLYGRKLDPYQAYEDRKRQIGLVVGQMVFISIAATLFIAITIILASLELRDYQPMAQSLYFQLIAVVVLRSLRLDKINFEVYKADPASKIDNAHIDMESEEKGRHTYLGLGLYIGIGAGILLGSLILVEGGTWYGFAMGATIGTVAGMVLGVFLDLKNSSSPTT
jgi:hypothetical protein